MDFLKTIAGKVVTGLVALAVVIGAISWWQMEPDSRQAILSATGRIFAWLGIVVFLPWLSFMVIGRVAKLESNLAGGILVGAYTVIETVVLAWLFHWRMPSATAWTFLLVGGLIAGAYNLLACDWIAEKMG